MLSVDLDTFNKLIKVFLVFELFMIKFHVISAAVFREEQTEIVTIFFLK